MKHIVFTGDWKEALDLLRSLTSAGYMVSILPEKAIVSIPCDLIVTTAMQADHLIKQKEISVPWLVWCLENGNGLFNLAYQNGATAVFPEGTTNEVIFQFIRRILDDESSSPKNDHITGNIIKRRYQKGDIIILEPDTIMEIEKGILAQTMVYQDGSEVLLGLFGPGQLVIPHPSDTCYIQLIAHTDLFADISPGKRSHTIRIS